MMLYRKEFTGLSNLLVVVFWMCLLFGCQNDEHDQGNTSEDQITKNIQNKIMPLGASRVQGFYPWFESYQILQSFHQLESSPEYDEDQDQWYLGSARQPSGFRRQPSHQHRPRNDSHEFRRFLAETRIIDDSDGHQFPS